MCSAPHRRATFSSRHPHTGAVVMLKL